MAAKPYAWEIAYAPASEAYIKNQSIIRPAFELLRKYEGVHELYSGIELEDPSVLVAIAWDSLEAHEAYEKRDVYQEYINDLLPELAGAAVPVHVTFTADPVPSFGAPITEVVWVTPKTAEDGDAVTAALDKIVAYAKNSATGLRGAAYGPVHETPGTFIAVLGWASLKAHVGERKSSKLVDLFQELLELTKSVVHGGPSQVTTLDQIVDELSAKSDVKTVHSALTPFDDYKN